jgi:hypothetical protein
VKSKVGKGTTFTIAVAVQPENKGGEKAWARKPESS